MKKLFLLLMCFAYIVSPIDFIPDFILPIGLGDDLAVLGGTIHKLLNWGDGRSGQVPESRQLAKKEDAQ